MRTTDILISRVLNPDGTPKDASPMRRGNSVEDLWEVTAHDHEPATRHPFAQALETARLWQSETGGDIYKRDVNDTRPILLEKEP